MAETTDGSQKGKGETHGKAETRGKADGRETGRGRVKEKGSMEERGGKTKETADQHQWTLELGGKSNRLAKRIGAIGQR